ncbi:MAG TPA: hypothetical protein VFJ05_02290 [Nitrososphaeraceae archaeon]|nr:hypothetical protein [Nitrososphaeraceae archaeon]
MWLPAGRDSRAQLYAGTTGESEFHNCQGALQQKYPSLALLHWMKMNRGGKLSLYVALLLPDDSAVPISYKIK